MKAWFILTLLTFLSVNLLLIVLARKNSKSGTRTFRGASHALGVASLTLTLLAFLAALFKGGIQDRGSGLVKFGLRWYNPTTGRWTQQDTLDAPLDPANAKRYAYAGGDPVNGNGPTGNDAGGAFSLG